MCNRYRIAPWIEYKQDKNIVNGTSDVRTDCATAIPGEPAVAKNRYKATNPNSLAVLCICGVRMNDGGVHKTNSTVTIVHAGKLLPLPPIFSPIHRSTVERNKTIDIRCTDAFVKSDES